MRSSEPGIACAHCGQATSARAAVGSDATPDLRFCCSGCATVYAVLHEAGLERYYTTREALPDPSSLLASAQGEESGALDDPAFAGRYVHADGGSACVTLAVRGIHCASCGWVIEHLLVQDPAVKSVHVSLGEERATVELVDPEVAPPLGRIGRRLASAGYSAHPLLDPSETEDEVAQRKEVRAELLRLGVAAACAMNLGLFAVSLYGGDRWGMDPGLRAMFQWLSLGVATPLLAFSALPILRRATSAVRHGLIHVDVPIAIAIVVMYVASAVSTVRGEGAVWFDSLGMLVLLLLGGRAMEGYVRRRTARRLRTLVSGQLGSASRVTPEGLERVPADALLPGDLLRLQPGDVCPVDALTVSGRSDVDLAVVDGESRPVLLQPGDELPAGARLLDGTLEAEVLRSSDSSGVARTRALVDQALRRRGRVELLADQVARWFVLVVLVVAGITGAVWTQVDPSRALPVVVAVLVVACPCALALATPLAFAAALRGAASRGLLLREPSALLRLGTVDLAAFDKTGTLTESTPSPGELTLTPPGEELGADRVLQLAAAVCARSHHPVSRAVVQACARVVPGPLAPPEDVRETAGVGIEGRVQGLRVQVGRPGARISVDGVHVADLPVEQELRQGAAEAVAALHHLGVQSALLSGDSVDRAERDAARVGISDAHGGMSPDGKADWITTAKDAHTVLFVGDGLNDARALASADVGLGMGGSVEVALEAADGVLLSQRPGTVAEGIQLGRRLSRTVRTNIAISVLYNALTVTGAALGFITPLIAATLMPLSSLVVVVRAGRLAHVEEEH
ncbi:MAG: cadmium-translocating P-type ATPase [Deltaproteobacteria bacterium]|nr:cadmium-translocating P-type ATPase [Deltaproteobacteria bacterium]